MNDLAGAVEAILIAAGIEFEPFEVYQQSIESPRVGGALDWNDAKRRRACGILSQHGYGVAFNGARRLTVWKD